MSFSLTERQLLDGSKTVTRRLGWRTLRAGDRLLAVRKCMGLRKGERQHALAQIEVVGVRRERLDAIENDDVTREGLDMSAAQFVPWFARHMRCAPSTVVTRIEFRRVQAR